MSATTTVADGSAEADAHPPVQIDRDAEPYRWRCPNGHTRWSPTNSHIWCTSCSDAAQQDPDVHPEHWEVYDADEECLVPYSAITIA